MWYKSRIKRPNFEIDWTFGPKTINQMYHGLVNKSIELYNSYSLYIFHRIF